MINEILSREEFKNSPPVLIDIGASGKVHSKWKKFARHSICISFDADDRKMGYVIHEQKTFKKQYVYNCIVSETKTEASDFYLTKSPYCSSTLQPDNEALNNYAFAEKFEVEKEIKLKTIDLPSVMQELNITHIDWFKTDSQGTDLNLFKSIGDAAISKVLVAEFEPGIIDAYKGEDKLYELLDYMGRQKFWMSDMAVHGSQRIHRTIKNKKMSNFQKKFLPATLTTSPGWAEVVYFNSLIENNLWSKRDLLLAWVFAVTQKQFGFAMEIAERGFQKFNDAIFNKMETYAYNKILFRNIYIPFYVAKVLVRKLFG